MSTPFPVREGDLAAAFTAVDDHLQKAYDAIEDAAWTIERVVSAWKGKEAVVPDPLPTYDDLGRLYCFAQHVRDVSGAQVIDRARQIVHALGELEEIMVMEASRRAA